MPYIGKQLVRGQNRKLDDISSGFNGSQTTFTLQVASQNVTVGSALQLWISVGGVIQNPLTDFTIAGNQITFTTAPAASLDFFGVIQGDVTDTNTPGDATVTTSKLATGLTVNLADGSAATSSLQLGGTDSGLFSSAADKVNVTTGGVERLEIGDSEVVFNDPSNDVDFRVESNGNANMLFVDAGNDRVGIGASGPKEVIDARGAAVFSGDHATSQNAYGTAHGIMLSSTSNLASIKAVSNGSNDVAIRFIPLSSGSGSEALRIDSSGRLLVGTTSSRSVSSLNSSLQVEGTGGDSSTISVTRNVASAAPPRVVFGKSRGTSVGSNVVVQSGDSLGEISFSGADGTDANSVAATINCKVDGTPGSNDMPGRLMFHTTADGASSPTERLRIDSSGDVLIGTTSGAGNRLYVVDNFTDSFVNPSDSVLRVENANTSGTSTQTSIAFTSKTSSSNADSAIVSQAENGSGNSSLQFWTDTSNGMSEKMRIDSSGRLLVGTSSTSRQSRAIFQGNSGGGQTSEVWFAADTNTPTGGLGNLYFSDNGHNSAAIIACVRDGGTWTSGSSQPVSLQFYTAANGSASPTERMRIDNAGNILLACTTNSGSSDTGVKIGQDNNPWLRIVGNESTGSNFFFSGYNTNATNNGYRIKVRFDGGIENHSANNVNLSDEREKKNIVNLDTKWDKVKSWELKKFHYNDDADTDDLRYGVIAQQIEEHCPEVLSSWIKQNAEDAVLDGEGNVVTPAVPEVVRKGVKEQQMMWMAIKALQEAQARIETLETKVAALEAG